MEYKFSPPTLDNAREFVAGVLSCPRMYAPDCFCLFSIIGTVVSLCDPDGHLVKQFHDDTFAKHHDGCAWNFDNTNMEELVKEFSDWLWDKDFYD